MAECFADTFCFTYTDCTPLLPVAQQTADAWLTNINITLEDDKKVLTNLMPTLKWAQMAFILAS